MLKSWIMSLVVFGLLIVSDVQAGMEASEGMVAQSPRVLFRMRVTDFAVVALPGGKLPVGFVGTGLVVDVLEVVKVGRETWYRVRWTTADLWAERIRSDRLDRSGYVRSGIRVNEPVAGRTAAGK